MTKLREVLLQESIGAIAIGFVLAQAVGAAVSTSMQAIMFYIGPRRDSIFSTAPRVFPWGNIVLPLISLVLYVLVAYLLLYWLYLRKRQDQETIAAADDGEAGRQ